MKNLKLWLVCLTLAFSYQVFGQSTTPPFSTITLPTCAIGANAHMVIDQFVITGPPSSTPPIIWSNPAPSGSNYYVDQTIRINKDADLIIRGIELQFAPGTGIIIEVGGMLTIDQGATLTSACESSPWNGIEVKGSSSDAQTTSLQGSITVDNAEISNAWVAISQAGGCAQEGGGIINVSNSTFTNNPNAISFTEYLTYTSTSSISNCEFIIDDDFQDFRILENLPPTSAGVKGWRIWNSRTGDASQITIKDNNGLIISGCRFFNYFSADASGNQSTKKNTNDPDLLLWSDPSWLGSAIVAENSEFEVEAIDLCEATEVRNEFVGWCFGISAYFGISGGQEMRVSGCDFTDNRTGVKIASSESVFIDENTFSVTDAIWHRFIETNANFITRSTPFNQYGIELLHEIDNLNIRGNTFDIDLLFNFSSFSSISYLLKSGSIPEELIIQDNEFTTLIQRRPTTINTNVATDIPVPTPGALGLVIPNAQSNPRIHGINLNNWTQDTDGSHEFFMDCNTFDMYEEDTSVIVNTNYDRHDIFIQRGTGTATTEIDIKSMEATASNPLNTFTDYTVSSTFGCMTGTGTANYNAFQIRTDMVVNYPIDANNTPFQSPTCTSATVSTPTASIPHAACTGFKCGDYAGTNLPPAPMNIIETTEHNMESSINLFPNPVSDFMNIESASSGTFKVMSLDGREVIQSSELPSGKSQIDISQLKSGKYVLHFIGDTNTEVHKFVKE